MGKAFTIEITENCVNTIMFCVDLPNMSYEVIEGDEMHQLTAGTLPEGINKKELYPVVWLKSCPDSFKDERACICFV